MPALVLFNSLEFLWLFLPITLVAVFALARFVSLPVATASLVCASLFFYAYWRPVYLLLIVASITVNYAVSREIRRRRQRRVLIAGVVFNLGLLGYFKYTDFAITTINDLFGTSAPTMQIVLPLAISFFTFQQIAFLVDCHQGKAAEHSFRDYMLFVSFFPQLIAGPIVHHTEMMPQFKKANYRCGVDDLAVGGTIFVIGLAKKVLIADALAPFANGVFGAAADGATPGFFEAWGGTLAYTGQLYFDFAGYSDMAIGLGRMFGIKLPVNFNSPYKATNIAEFWRRWHMTLSRFLRDYLYIPLGGNRHGERRRYFSLAVTMLLGGLWHGAGWTFVVWGGLHGAYLVAHRLWKAAIDPRFGEFRGRAALGWLLTFCAVCVGWVYFRSADLATSHRMLEGMLGLSGASLPGQLQFLAPLKQLGVEFAGMGSLATTAIPWIVVALAIALLAPNSQEIMGEGSRIALAAPATGRLRWRPAAGYAVAIGVLLFFCVKAQFALAPSEFLYFNF